MGGLKRGGLETFVMNMYRSLDREKIQFDFLLTQETSGGYEGEAVAMGANIYRVPPRNKGYRAYRKALEVFFRNHRGYAAVHAHVSSLTSIEPVYYAKRYGIPVRILHAHNSSVADGVRLHWLHRALHYVYKPFVHSWATHYWGCSDKALDWVYKYTGVRSKAVMINNGINCREYVYSERKREEVRNELNIAPGDFVIGHVGRFTEVKNQAFLLDILEEMHKTQSGAKLLLVGEGCMMAEVKAKAKAKGLADAVIFTGVRSDVARLLQAMDVFVMPSLFEGLPVSMVEAQAAGLPVVASSAISHDSDLTGTVLFKSIAEPAEAWAESVVEWREKIGRTENTGKIQEAGFDSSTTAAFLYNVYTKGV